MNFLSPIDLIDVCHCVGAFKGGTPRRQGASCGSHVCERNSRDTFGPMNLSDYYHTQNVDRYFTRQGVRGACKRALFLAVRGIFIVFFIFLIWSTKSLRKRDLNP